MCLWYQARICSAAWNGDLDQIRVLAENKVLVCFDLLSMPWHSGSVSLAQAKLPRLSCVLTTHYTRVPHIQVDVGMGDYDGRTPLVWTDVVASLAPSPEILNLEHCRHLNRLRILAAKVPCHNNFLSTSHYLLWCEQHLAACAGHTSVIEYLLKQPTVMVNAVDRFGGTPLQDAVRSGKQGAAGAVCVCVTVCACVHVRVCVRARA